MLLGEWRFFFMLMGCISKRKASSKVPLSRGPLRLLNTVRNYNPWKQNYFTSCDPHHDISKCTFGRLLLIFGLLCAIYFDILSGIYFSNFWHMFWHSIWQSIWHIFWYCIWHVIGHFWQSWHFFCATPKPELSTSFKNSRKQPFLPFLG